MPPGPTIVTNFCSASFALIAATVALSQGLSQSRDVDTKADLVGPLVGPDTLDQIALADNSARLLYQRNEDVHGTCAEGYGLRAVRQTPAINRKLEGAEA